MMDEYSRKYITTLIEKVDGVIALGDGAIVHEARRMKSYLKHYRLFQSTGWLSPEEQKSSNRSVEVAVEFLSRIAILEIKK